MNLYFDILNSINQGIVYADNDHIIRYMDELAIQHYEKMGGRDLIGQNLIGCHRPESIVKIEEYMKKMADKEFDEVLIRRTKEYDLYMTAVRDKEGHMYGYLERFAKRSEGVEEVEENTYQYSAKYFDELVEMTSGNAGNDWIIDLIGEGKSILELSCASGELGLSLAIKGNHVDGIDDSQELINIANQKIVSSQNMIKGSYHTCVKCPKEYQDKGDYDYIIVNHNYINRLYTDKAKIDFLSRIKDLVKIGGKVILVGNSMLFDPNNTEDGYFEKLHFVRDDQRIVRMSKVIKYFEKLSILNYTSHYKIINDGMIKKEFEEGRRVSLLRGEKILELATSVGYQGLSHKKYKTSKDQVLNYMVDIIELEK